jgi:hypothetical protein
MDLITILMQVYSTVLTGEEMGELFMIVACVAYAARPMTLAELEVASDSFSLTGGTGSSLGETIRDKYTPLFDLVRDDEISLGRWKAHYPASAVTFSCIPAATIVTFAHSTLRQYFLNHCDLLLNGKGKDGHVFNNSEPHFHLLKQCLSVFVNPESEPLT